MGCHTYKVKETVQIHPRVDESHPLRAKGIGLQSEASSNFASRTSI